MNTVRPPNDSATPVPAVSWAGVSTAAQAKEEKHSISTQLETNRVNAALLGAEIVRQIVVPGESRYHDTIAECIEYMHSQRPPCYAYDELLDILAEGKIKLLLCRDADRFARTLSMGAEFVRKCYRAGVTIYSDTDGWQRSERQATDWIARAALRAQAGVMFLVDARAKSAPGLAKRGLYTNGKIPATHNVIRDQRGKRIGVEINAEFQRAAHMAAQLLLEGVPYPEIESELWARYGIGEHGGPYRPGRFHDTFTNAYTYGNTAHSVAKARRHARFGMWIFEDGHAIPDGVNVEYGTHPPVIEGDLLQLVIGELTRRSGNFRPKPKHHQWTRQVFVCAACRSFLHQSYGSQHVYTTKAGHQNTYAPKRYLRCGTNADRTNEPCPERKFLPLDNAQAAVTAWLYDMVSESSDAPAAPAVAVRLETLRQEVTRTERLLNRLILQKAEAPDNAAGVYDAQIAAQAERLEDARARVKALAQSDARTVHQHERRNKTLEQLRSEDIATFWQRPAAVVNASLLALLDGNCFAVENGEVVGLVQSPPLRSEVRKRRRRG